MYVSISERSITVWSVDLCFYAFVNSTKPSFSQLYYKHSSAKYVSHTLVFVSEPWGLPSCPWLSIPTRESACQFLWIRDFIRDYVDFIDRSGENWHLTILESGIQLKFTLALNPANVSKWQWDSSCWRALWHGLCANHFVCLWRLCVSSFSICMIFVLFFFLLYALVRTCSTVLHSENTNPCLSWIFEREHQAFTTKYISCCSS